MCTNCSACSQQDCYLNWRIGHHRWHLDATSHLVCKGFWGKENWTCLEAFQSTDWDLIEPDWTPVCLFFRIGRSPLLFARNWGGSMWIMSQECWCFCFYQLTETRRRRRICPVSSFHCLWWASFTPPPPPSPWAHLHVVGILGLVSFDM